MAFLNTLTFPSPTPAEVSAQELAYIDGLNENAQAAITAERARVQTVLLGGTGATTAAGALTNLGAAAASDVATLFPGSIGDSGQRDGSVTISGTVTLTRPKQYGILTLATGSILVPNGYQIHARKIVQQGTGRISADANAGNNASGATAGTGATAFAVAGGTIQAGTHTAMAGATGGTGAGVNATSTTAGGNNIMGGGGGGAVANSGGSGSSGAGGTAGNSAGNYNGVFAPFEPSRISGPQGGICTGGAAGGGGGAGAGDGTNSGGGGGGAGCGGNICDVWAGEIDVTAGTGPVITAKGGNGGNGGNSAAGNTGGGGGGCGGGGGVIRCLVGKVTGSLSPAITANGGNGGAGGNGQGTGIGGKGGGAGQCGAVYLLKTRVWTVVEPANQSAPAAPVTTAGGTGATGALGEVSF